MRPTERPPRAKNSDAKSQGTRDNIVRLRHVDPARVPLWHAATRPPQLPDLLNWLAREQPHRQPDFLSEHSNENGTERIDAIMRRRWILFAGFVARMEDTKVLHCVMFGELMGGAGCVGGAGK